MTRTTLAVAADYADAMLIARRWKNALFLLLLLFLLIQIGVFLTFRLYGGDSVMLKSALAFNWLINFTDFLAIICVLVLAVVLLLITIIMLVGRLIGVSHVTSAFCWCVLLGALLFPWQSIWNYPVAGIAQTQPAAGEEVGARYGLPGVLYTWPELLHHGHFAGDPWSQAWLGWARFVGWPVAAIIILFAVQVRSTRGLRFALGEADVKVVEPGGSSPPEKE